MCLSASNSESEIFCAVQKKEISEFWYQLCFSLCGLRVALSKSPNLCWASFAHFPMIGNAKKKVKAFLHSNHY